MRRNVDFFFFVRQRLIDPLADTTERGSKAKQDGYQILSAISIE